MTIFREAKFLVFFYCAFTTLSLNSISSFAVPWKILYADHCASLVPESTLKPNSRNRSHVYLHKGYYYSGVNTGYGGHLSRNSSSYGHYDQLPNIAEFHVWSLKETDVEGLFKIRANLQCPQTRTYYYTGNSTSGSNSRFGSTHAYTPRADKFRLQGFWSESSGKLCMVGYGRYSKQGYSSPAVLKLYNVMNSTSITSMISGTVESLIPSSDIVKDPRYFDPISILMFPQMNYRYTLVSSNSIDDTSFGGSDNHDPSSSLKLDNFCSLLSTVVQIYEFDLIYSSKCVSATNCTPVAVLDRLPRFISLKDIGCWETGRSLRVLVQFTDRHTWIQRRFNRSTTLIAEGSWNAKKDQLQFVACHFLEAATDSFNNSLVGDCSMRMSLRFPATWTIGNTGSVVGYIWSNKSKTESGYFENITFKTPQREAGRVLVPGAKYEYTRLDQVNKLCPRKKTTAHAHKTNIYPSPISYDMRFDMSARNSKGLVAWGNSVPVSVGNKLYPELISSTQYTNSAAINEDENKTLAPLSSVVMISSYEASKLTNISYSIGIRLLEQSVGKSGNITIRRRIEMQISAEGIYDTEGSLCMVGCRNVALNSNYRTAEDSVDCEVLVNFQFSPENQLGNNSGHVKVSIESTRKKSDPLHFERLELSSVSTYMIEVERSIWWMDMEITFVLVSTTLACVFVALQLFHVKKHPDVLPSVSILMLLILTLGYMIPLLFDGLFTRNATRREVVVTRGWLKLAVNDIVLMCIRMVAFFLQLRLLQQTWSSRSATAKKMELWGVEMKALPLYMIGFFGASMNLKSYAGFVLDGFLIPQYLLNLACNSTEKALSASFYIGTTLVRVLPHAYDLYRTYSSVHQQLDESYIYASPGSDFYSTAWDWIILMGGLLLSLVIFLQQKFGGRCFLPGNSRELASFEAIPPVTEAELPN